MNKENKKYIIIIIIFSIIILGFVGTYAYFSSDASSEDEALSASAASFSFSLEVTPIYSDNKLIPMEDSLAVTGYNNECIDSNNYVVCQAYAIKLTNSSSDGQFIRLDGYINFELNGVTNLSYMVLDSEDGSTVLYNESDEVILYKSATSIVSETDMDLDSGDDLNDYIELDDGESRTVILVIWLSDTGSAQDSFDANGRFTASVTYYSIRGDQLSSSITGTINGY